MIKKICCVIILFSTVIRSYSQSNDTTYYDSNWKEIELTDSIVYFKVAEKIDDETVKEVNFYYSNMMVESIKFYTNGRKSGRWTYYSDDGELTLDFEYINGGANRRWYKFRESSLEPDEEGVYHTVNIVPVFGNNDDSLDTYINDNFNLPKKAIRKGVRAFSVGYKLIIDSTGTVTEVRESKIAYKMPDGSIKIESPKSKLKYGINKKLKKFLLEMPNWKPATVEGRPVKAAQNVIINYSKKN